MFIEHKNSVGVFFFESHHLSVCCDNTRKMTVFVLILVIEAETYVPRTHTAPTATSSNCPVTTNHVMEPRVACRRVLMTWKNEVLHINC